jgi:hypothetical protein
MMRPTRLSFAISTCAIALVAMIAAPGDGMAQSRKATPAPRAAPSPAPVAERIEIACRADRTRLCPAYAPGSASLRACLTAKVREASSACLGALVDAGHLDRRTLRP